MSLTYDTRGYCEVSHHTGVHRPCLVPSTKHSGSYSLHVEVGLTLGHGDDPDLSLLQLKRHCTQTETFIILFILYALYMVTFRK